MKRYLRDFLRDTYPGAKKSPVDYVKLLAMPDIKPDMAIKGTKKLDQILKHNLDSSIMWYHAAR